MRVVGFDFIGTLCRAGTCEDNCVQELFVELGKSGLDVPYQEFIEAYNEIALKYLEIRKSTLREVNNRVWIAEALEKVGVRFDKDDEVIRRAAEAYFRPYVEMIHVPEYVVPILSDIGRKFKIGLITNFTYAPAVHDALERNNLARLFNSIIISDEVGWRKPHPNIFQRFLEDVSARSSEAFFVGDDPRFDVVGASRVGMKAILLRSEDTRFSESYYTASLDEGSIRPNLVLQSLDQVRDYLFSIDQS